MSLFPGVALACRQQLFLSCASAPPSSAVPAAAVEPERSCSTARLFVPTIPCAASAAALSYSAPAAVPCTIGGGLRGPVVSSGAHMQPLHSGTAVASALKKREARCRRRAAMSKDESEEEEASDKEKMWMGGGLPYSGCYRRKKRICYAAGVSSFCGGSDPRCCNDQFCSPLTAVCQHQDQQPHEQQPLLSQPGVQYQRYLEQQQQQQLQQEQQIVRVLLDEQGRSLGLLPSFTGSKDLRSDARADGAVAAAAAKDAEELRDGGRAAAATDDVAWMGECSTRRSREQLRTASRASSVYAVSAVGTEAVALLQQQQHPFEQHHQRQLSDEQQWHTSEVEENEAGDRGNLRGFSFCWKDQPLPSPSMQSCGCDGKSQSTTQCAGEEGPLVCSSSCCVDCRREKNSTRLAFSPFPLCSATTLNLSSSPAAAAALHADFQQQQLGSYSLQFAEAAATHAAGPPSGAAAGTAAEASVSRGAAGFFPAPARSCCTLVAAAVPWSSSPSSSAGTAVSSPCSWHEQAALKQQKEPLTPLQQKLKKQLQNQLEQQMRLYKQQLLRTEFQPRSCCE